MTSDQNVYASGTVGNQVQYDFLDWRISREIDYDGAGATYAADYDYNVYQGDNAALENHDQDGFGIHVRREGRPRGIGP